MQNYCHECGEMIKGRTDKKFCDDQCRTQFHNRSAVHERRVMYNVNSRLRKNRKILSELLGSRETFEISKENLLLRGFDFNYHTHQAHASGKSWKVIYDYACCNEKKDVVILSKWNRDQN